MIEEGNIGLTKEGRFPICGSDSGGEYVTATYVDDGQTQEVEVGQPSELLEQVLGQEVEDGVLPGEMEEPKQ